MIEGDPNIKRRTSVKLDQPTVNPNLPKICPGVTYCLRWSLATNLVSLWSHCQGLLLCAEQGTNFWVSEWRSLVYLSVVELLFWVRSLSFKTKKQNCSLFSFSFSVYDHGQLRPRFQAESLKSWLMNFSWEILEWSSICIRLVNADDLFEY